MLNAFNNAVTLNQNAGFEAVAILLRIRATYVNYISDCLGNMLIPADGKLGMPPANDPLILADIDKSPAYYTLLRMKDLQTLILTQCNNLPFIHALNPNRNPSKLILCPRLKKLVLYVEGLESFNIVGLMSMAKGRVSGGVRLSCITIVGLGELMPRKEVFKLGEYVGHVDYRIGEKPPKWDSTFMCG